MHASKRATKLGTLKFSVPSALPFIPKMIITHLRLSIRILEDYMILVWFFREWGGWFKYFAEYQNIK